MKSFLSLLFKASYQMFTLINLHEAMNKMLDQGQTKSNP